MNWNPLRRWRDRKATKLRAAEIAAETTWRTTTLTTLISIIPASVPWYWGFVPSFLQESEPNMSNPASVDLFLAGPIIAIDLVGYGDSPDWTIASKVLDESTWRERQARASQKRKTLDAYGISQILIDRKGPVDQSTLREIVLPCLSRAATRN